MEFGKKYVSLLMLPLDLQSRGLSGGMKRKLSLIIALIGKTKVSLFFHLSSSRLDKTEYRTILYEVAV